ncbi:MAG: 3-hydroxyacyl-CoA dehydrogenase NAD-binding domain-containing protein [Pseudomonadota bacterium]
MIQKVAVLGAGVMGSGIAAQIANAGLPVVLLDIPPKDTNLPRNAIAAGAIDRMLKTDPAPFMSPENAKLIMPGNLEDDLELLRDCDLIIEVVIEDLAIKHATYAKIAPYRKKGAIISSNTSTIPLHKLVETMDKAFQADFLITHFFNPPRYMRLLELVVGTHTKPEHIATVTHFCDIVLGKGVVRCNDTPGFIANRLGVFWLQAGVNEALRQNISVDLADAVMGKPVGIPKTGVFGLIDLVGIDLMPKLATSMLGNLAANDPYRTLYQDYPFISQMIAAGYTGRKGKGGFYRLHPDGKDKGKQSLRLNADHFDADTSYGPVEKIGGLPSLDAGKDGGLRAVLSAPDAGGRYAWAVLSQTLSYAAALVPEVADSITDVDTAMRLGYNWKNGPFEMMDAVGPAWLAERLKADGKPVPDLLQRVGDGTFYKITNGVLHAFGTDGKYHVVKRPAGVLLLSDIKRAQKPAFKTASAALWDVGDGVLCLEFTGKMNALDEHVFTAIHTAIDLVGDGKSEWKGLVVYNEGSAFSVGANLALAMFAMNIALWPQIEALVSGGQQAYMALKYAPFPVVVAPSGMALGGGCEILLHADHVQAHAETYCGLVEVGVGLIPGWGGCKEMLLRAQVKERAGYDQATGGKKIWFSPKNTPMGAVRAAFEIIATAKTAKSAQDAKAIGYLRDHDGITMNRDRLLFDAKQQLLKLAPNYVPPAKPEHVRLPGPSGATALTLAVSDLQKSGKATPYDGVVSAALATVLSGGENGDWTRPVGEDDILALELAAFMQLVRNPGTLARIEHMLEKGKPLRN